VRSPSGAGAVPFVGGDRLRELVPVAAAVDALEGALRGAGGFPAVPLPDTPPRSAVRAAGGDLLLMPAVSPRYAGVKLVSVAPGNPGHGLPRVQGVYVLFDAATLTPVLLVDGVALTSLRTPALSAVAVRALAPPGPVRLVVVGTGPQAQGHVEAVGAVRDLAHVTLAGRDGDRARDLARRLGVGCPVDVLVGTAPFDELGSVVAQADVVVCATTARTPVLRSPWVRDGAVVVAVGSHEPGARELPGELLARSTVVVESRDAAFREAGDVVLAVAEGRVDPADVRELAEVVAGGVVAGPGPWVFKSVGEAWQDLVVASLLPG